ncbi:MAG: shikimate kinase-domain-containing protein [Benniella sp.]|nr:MAG: shikimate kinase-domain-containing protein [Benniella sp.]
MPDNKAPSSEGVKGSTIVVIGMRGAGKTTMGQFAAAQVLKRKFEDVDHYFEKTLKTTTTMDLSTAVLGLSIAVLGILAAVLGLSTTVLGLSTAVLGLLIAVLGLSTTAPEPLTIQSYIEKHGWKAFRRRETEMLIELLRNHPTGYVISCGGGIVESDDSRNALQEHRKKGGIVFHLARGINDIEAYLNKDITRPAFPEPMRDVWLRRKGWYQLLSDFEFVAPDQQQLDNVEAKDRAKEDFERVLHVVTGERRKRPPPLPRVSELVPGTNVAEFRVDTLANPGDPDMFRDHVAQEFSLFRRRHSNLPILFTIRSKSQGGQWPDENIDGMTSLLKDGLKWGVEYLDIEIRLPLDKIRSVLARKGNTLSVASLGDDNRDVASWMVQEKIMQPGWDGLKCGVKYLDIDKSRSVLPRKGNNRDVASCMAQEEKIWISRSDPLLTGSIAS